MPKNITSNTFLIVFKFVENYQYILMYVLYPYPSVYPYVYTCILACNQKIRPQDRDQLTLFWCF